MSSTSSTSPSPSPPRDLNRARKSTASHAPRALPPSRRRRLTNISPFSRTPEYDNKEFAMEEQRLVESIRRRNAIRHAGPQGLGRGKGAIKMIRRLMPRLKPIERAAAKITEGNSIQRLPFDRLVRQIVASTKPGFRIQLACSDILKDATESYLVNLFEGSNLCTTFAGRVTLMTRDIEMFRRLKRTSEGVECIGREIHNKEDIARLQARQQSF